MTEILTERTPLDEAEQDWLRLLVSEWQLLADLSFSDLVLWVQDHDPNVFWAAAQIRPTTGPTSLVDDVVGDIVAYAPEHLVTDAFLSGHTTQTSDGKLSAGMPVATHALPVRRSGRVIAVVEQSTSQLAVSEPSVLEKAYQQSAAELAQMITSEAFPFTGDTADQALGPRVGDGFIRLDSEGYVEYASPNALSAYRRLGLIGDLTEAHLATLTAELLPRPVGPVDESVASVLSGRTARYAEAVSGHAHLLIRAVPLLAGADRLGAVVLCRDVSDLRSRERALVTKDATIREIHHRVKNNLQTVAALLRMQARRIDSPEAKLALTEAMSRVASIAIVHETLSQAFDEMVEFDRVVDGLIGLVGHVAATSSAVSARRVGSFGTVSPTIATSLAMVVTELCQNAVEHGFPGADTDAGAAVAGEVRVVPTRTDGWLRVEITDDGGGLPAGFDWQGVRSLGLSIVSSLVAELEGTVDLGANPTGRGTRAVVMVPLQDVAGRRLDATAAG